MTHTPLSSETILLRQRGEQHSPLWQGKGLITSCRWRLRQGEGERVVGCVFVDVGVLNTTNLVRSQRDSCGVCVTILGAGSLCLRVLKSSRGIDCETE